jgi:hypothetical protein
MSDRHDKSPAKPSAQSGDAMPPVIFHWGQELAAATGEKWDDKDWPEPAPAPSIFDDEQDEEVAAALRADLAELVGADGKGRPAGTIAPEDAEIAAAVRGIEANFANWKLATANTAIAALRGLLNRTQSFAARRAGMREKVRAADARLAAVRDIPDGVRQPLLVKSAAVLAAIDVKGGLDWEVEADVIEFGDAVTAAEAMERKRADLRADVQAAVERMAAERGLRDDERGPLQERRDPLLAVVARSGGVEAGVDAEVAEFVKAVDGAIAQAKAGVFVGPSGVSASRVATVSFAGAYEAALAVLNDLASKGWRFRDEPAVIAYVGRQPAVKAAMEAAAAAREQAAAERAAKELEQQRAREARAATPVVFTFGKGDPLYDALEVRQYDIDNGAWRQLTTQSAQAADRGRSRKVDDFELVTTIGGKAISFHVHGPRFAKGDPTPGAFMADGANPKSKQVPMDVIQAIVKSKGRPKAWDT